MTTTHPLGTHEQRDDGTHVLRYERLLHHPIDRVWRAVTEPSQVVGWWGDADIDLRHGGRVQFRWLNSDEDGNQAVATGTVARLEPPRIVEYDTDLHGRLRFELESEGDAATRLRFTVEHPDLGEHLDSVLPGWHIHLEHLDDALDGRPVDWPRWNAEHRPRWTALHEQYLALADA
jgi:uncharacterized protein YndB with AHSA1/START domain